MFHELTTIATFATSAEASPLRATLDGQGIRTYLQGGTTADTLWHVGTAIGGVKLQVATTDVEAALECLGWTDNAQPSQPVAAWTCPACQEKIEAGFEVCWNCGTSFDADPSSFPPVVEPAPIDDASGFDCPMCGERLSDDVEECKHCGERIDGASFDDPTELNAEGEESEQIQRTRAVLMKAFRAAIFGFVICPPLLNIYSALCLADYQRLRVEYDLPVDWRARVAMGINMFVLLGAVLLFLGIMTRG